MKLKKCVFLTMDSLDDYVCMDHLLIEPMAAAGWVVEQISWRDANVDWAKFDIVIIRSPWDYQTQPDAFLAVLEKINSLTRLENSLPVVRWNLDKTYLKELSSRGVEIVTTEWGTDLKPGELGRMFEILAASEIILKPVISANADDTFRLTPESGLQNEAMLCELFSNRRFMVQPFVDAILSEGEFSLFYFGGEYSHAILKTPKTDDFRVQEEHGGTIQAIQPCSVQRAVARRAMDVLSETPLYARVDLVRTGMDRFAIMELELIEPSLYFDTNLESIDFFIRQLDIRWESLPKLDSGVAKQD